MYKIGEFSVLSKTTVKTLRYYEKEGLLIPTYIDKETGYRFYETDQLIELAKIVSLRQMGISINNIKKFINGVDIQELLKARKDELKIEKNVIDSQLLQINNMLEEKRMEKEIFKKTLPDYTVYYKDGIIKKYDDLTQFILTSADECVKLNPDIKCIEPDYCFVSYLDGEYKEENIRIRYAQAVTKEGLSDKKIKFMKLNSVEAICTYHRGSYSTLRETYGFIVEWIEKNGFEIIEPIRERYIDGMWNKQKEEDWLTEIQIPVQKK